MPTPTMPLPVTQQDSLASACRRPPEDVAVFRGELSGVRLMPLLELMERIGCTGRLMLFRGCATLSFDWIHGRIVAAGAHRTYSIASEWRDGEFELLPISFVGQPPTVSVAELALEVAREIDERSPRKLANSTARG